MAGRRNRWQAKAGHAAAGDLTAGSQESSHASSGGFWEEKSPAASRGLPANSALASSTAVLVTSAVDTTGQPLDLDLAAERDALEAIYGAEFEVLGLSEWRVDLASPPNAPPAALRVHLPTGYPMSETPPVPLVDCDCDCARFRAAAASAIEELVSQYEPLPEGCVYQWAERLREELRPVLEDVASVAAAEAAHQEELSAAAHGVLAATAAASLETERAMHLQLGQAKVSDAFSVEIQHGEPFTDRKSTFQAHAAQVSSHGQVMWAAQAMRGYKRVADATHNILAYRFYDEERGAHVADNDDDGEHGAGGNLAQLLNLAGCEGVLVMVSRWYGGVHLGADRFKDINRAASQLLDDLGWTNRKGGAKPAQGSGARGTGRK